MKMLFAPGESDDISIASGFKGASKESYLYRNFRYTIKIGGFVMKSGILIYQQPSGLGRNIGVAPMSLSVWPFGLGKNKKYLEKLNKELEKLEDSITVMEDDTEANLEKIASRNYDFIICTPGLQKRVLPSKELPPIIYMESIEFHNTIVNPTINKIKKIVSSD